MFLSNSLVRTGLLAFAVVASAQQPLLTRIHIDAELKSSTAEVMIKLRVDDILLSLLRSIAHQRWCKSVLPVGACSSQTPLTHAP